MKKRLPGQLALRIYQAAWCVCLAAWPACLIWLVCAPVGAAPGLSQAGEIWLEPVSVSGHAADVVAIQPCTRALDGQKRSGQCAYVADSSGLSAWDVSDPAHTEMVGKLEKYWWVKDVKLAGQYAYVADGSGGLHVVDVSDPAHLTRTSFYDTPSLSYRLWVSGSMVYLANGDAGVYAVNVASPTHPVGGVVYNSPGHAQSVAMSGSLLYVADGPAGLRVVDLSEAGDRPEVGRLEGVNARYVAVEGDYVYLADNDGLRIVDVSNPAAPVELGLCDTPGRAMALAVQGRYVYVADGDHGLHAVNVADPAAPRVESTYRPPAGTLASDVVVQEKYVYLAVQKMGLATLRAVVQHRVYLPVVTRE